MFSTVYHFTNPTYCTWYSRLPGRADQLTAWLGASSLRIRSITILRIACVTTCSRCGLTINSTVDSFSTQQHSKTGGAQTAAISAATAAAAAAAAASYPFETQRLLCCVFLFPKTGDTKSKSPSKKRKKGKKATNARLSGGRLYS